MADAFISRLYAEDRRLFGDKQAADRRAKLPQADKDRLAAKENWDAYVRSRDSGHLDWVKMARKCDAYYSGDQWEEGVVNELDSQNRPHLTINQVKSTVNAIKGEYIKSQQEITFQPRGRGATTEVARALSLVMKQIQYNNKSRWNETTVLEDGLIEDRGYFDIRIDFDDNVLGEIREVVRDPRDVLLDPGAKEYDPATWKEVITTRWLTPDEIEAMWGRGKADQLRYREFGARYGHDSIQFDVPTATFGDIDNTAHYAYAGDSLEVARVRIIERQHKKLARCRYFVDPDEGDMRPVPDNWDDARAQEHAAKFDLDILEKPTMRIRWTVSADDVLLQDDWSLYKRFTIIPFFPYFRRGKPTGLVRDLLSPQDMLNKVSSQELHVVNTTANSGWMFEEGSLVNMDADDLEVVGAKTGLVLEYRKGAAAPEKIQPNQVPTGLNMIAQKAQVYFRQVSGVPETFMGLSSREVSGVTIKEQNQAATTPMEVVFDNLQKTRQYRADHMLDLIQAWYTETRLVKVTELDIDGREQSYEMQVNQVEEVYGEDGQLVESRILNDLTLGEYTVVATSVPHHETMQDTIFSQCIQMREIGVAVPDWVLLENSRLPNRREVAEVVKQLQGMAEPTPEEVERQVMMEMLQLQGMQASVRGMMAKAALDEAMAQKALVEAGVAQQQPFIEMQSRGAELRMQMEMMDRELQGKIAELQTRIAIAREKNDTVRFTSQVETLGKRTSAALQYDAALKKIAAGANANVSKLLGYLRRYGVQLLDSGGSPASEKPGVQQNKLALVA